MANPKRGIKLDVCDRDLFEWGIHLDTKGYAISGCRKYSSRRLHRVVAERMGLDLTKQIDHKNGEKLDCRRRNLRAATPGQNRANSKINVNSQSGLKGVKFRKPKALKKGRKRRSDYKPRWSAQITIDGKKVWLGDFSSPEAAHVKYCEAAKEAKGQFARVG